MFIPVLLNSAAVTVLQSVAYVFVLNLSLPVCIQRDGQELVGRLDENGIFIERVRYSGGISRQEVGVLLNGSPPNAKKKVYELRWGVLVPGAFNASGHFVPEVGGEIIRFADYRYSPSTTRIWNLPGYFRAAYPIDGSRASTASVVGAAAVIAAQVAPQRPPKFDNWPAGLPTIRDRR